MSNRKETFDLHVEIDAFDDGEWYEAKCTVTYPAYVSQPAMTKEYKAEHEWEAISKATQDIQKFLDEPDEWVEAYVKESTNVGRKLSLAKEQLAQHTTELNRYRSYTEQYHKYVEKDVQDIAQLEAQITQERVV